MAGRISSLKEWPSSLPLDGSDPVANAQSVNDRLKAAVQWGLANNSGVTVKLDGLTYNVDRTISVNGAKKFTLDCGPVAGKYGTFQRVTSDGGLGNTSEARRLSHLAVTLCEDTFVCDPHVRGQNTLGKRSPSVPNQGGGIPYRNIWEAQHGVTVSGCKRTIICRPNVKQVWGDLNASEPYSSGTALRRNEDLSFIAPYGRLGGRTSMLLHAFDGLHITDADFDQVPSSFFHHEAQSALWTGTDLVIERALLGPNGGYVLHCNGEAKLDGITLNGAVRTGAPVSVFLDGSGSDQGDVFGYRNALILGTRWDKAQTGGYLHDMNHVDGVTIAGMVGPLRDSVATSGQMRYRVMQNFRWGAGNQVTRRGVAIAAPVPSPTM